MRYVLVCILMVGLLATGCSRDDPIFAWFDADGYYFGRVCIDQPGKGWEHSFDARLRLYDNGRGAVLKDNCGKFYEAYRVDYDFWSDRLNMYFTVRETRWSARCGNEVIDWEICMSGRIYEDRYTGEVKVDIDPDDYYSDWCHLDCDPAPQHLGSFHLTREFDTFWF
jgi:hypothetical protein